MYTYIHTLIRICLFLKARAALQELKTALLASGGGEERERNAEVADAAGGGGMCIYIYIYLQICIQIYI